MSSCAAYTLLPPSSPALLCFSFFLHLPLCVFPLEKTTTVSSSSPSSPSGSFSRRFTKRSRFKQCPGYSRTLPRYPSHTHADANTYSSPATPRPRHHPDSVLRLPLSTFSYQAAVPRRHFSLPPPPPPVVTRDRLAGVTRGGGSLPRGAAARLQRMSPRGNTATLSRELAACEITGEFYRRVGKFPSRSRRLY